MGLPCVDFKNRTTSRGSKDRSEQSPRFASNGIHMKTTSKRQNGSRLKCRIDIQDILEHLKSKDTCTITMMRRSSTFK